MTSDLRSASFRARLGSVIRMDRPILRMQLAILYSGFFLCLLAVALGAAGVLLIRGSQSSAAGAPHASPAPSGSVLLIVGIGVVATVVALAGAWWLAGRFLRPLRTMTNAANEISATNLHQRLDLSGPDDELAQLGRTLNSLFGRLEASFESQRRFVANASHELRTPLAGQRTLLQVALGDPAASANSLREVCEQAIALGKQQERLIEALLALATSERGIERRQATDLADLAAIAIAGSAQLAEAQEIVISSSLAAAPVNGDPVLAQLLVGNLIDNAVRHNSPHGTVTVQTSSTTGESLLTVVNTGPLIPNQALAYLFEPFRTTQTDRVRHGDGHGLGLAIVQAIASAHGATTDAKARPTGGLEITVTFPAVQEER
jgi:signal transduction histidine kinase